MSEREEKYRKVFIPKLHTFSYDDNRVARSKEVSTPPLIEPMVVDTRKIPRSNYAMFSGTASEIETMRKMVMSSDNEGVRLYVPPWVSMDWEHKASPTILSNPNLLKVYGRAGWGTIWTCQVEGKEFVHIPYTKGDDPEIYFNTKTLELMNLMKETEKIKQEFGTLNGMNFVARNILADVNPLL